MIDMIDPLPKPHDAAVQVGERLRRFRMDKGYSLAALSQLTGISDATLSRVENAQTLVSAHNLYVLGKVLEVDITAFYAADTSPIRSGIRSVSRQGEGQHVATARYHSTILGADLADKQMHPAIDIITATSLEAIGGLASHSGEEFLYVLSGTLVLHSAHYAPLLLNTGDSIYFDGSMPHAYLSSDGAPARILVTTSSEQGVVT
jgi:transcriptional regulator with XRE-family HTH domain